MRHGGRRARASGTRALWLALALGLAGASAHAASLRFCDLQDRLGAAQRDKLLRFGAVIKDELERSGARLAIIARSGLDLGRFGIRYSHAGVSLKASAETPWAVRQLYYACDEGRPRIFDQGLAAFLMGTDEPSLGYVSILLLPAGAAAALERAALDNRLALALLGGRYSANAYPFSLRFQNCNQWLVELLAHAWGARDADTTGQSARARAQDWLHAQGYAPPPVHAGWLMGLGDFIPWVHRGDHPAEDVEAFRYRVSLPASIEAFVRAQWPLTERLEFCHDTRRVVVRRGFETIAEGCVPAAGDRVVPLQ